MREIGLEIAASAIVMMMNEARMSSGRFCVGFGISFVTLLLLKGWLYLFAGRASPLVLVRKERLKVSQPIGLSPRGGFE